MTRTHVKSSGTKGEMLLFGQGVCYSCGSPGHFAQKEEIRGKLRSEPIFSKENVAHVKLKDIC